MNTYFILNVNLLLLDGISGGELVFVFLIILIFFGAKSIPKFARTFGKGIRQVNDATQEIQRYIKKSAFDTSEEIKNIKKSLTDLDK